MAYVIIVSGAAFASDTEIFSPSLKVACFLSVASPLAKSHREETMFQLTIAFGESTVWSYLFAKQERADAVFDMLKGVDPIEFTDDYGQRFFSTPQCIKAFQLENYELGKQAFAERQLHAWRCQARAQTLGKADTVLRAAAAQNIPMQSPFPNGPQPN